MSKTTVSNVNAMLSSIVLTAINIVNESHATGEIDFSDTESMFNLMLEVAALPVCATNASGRYIGMDDQLCGVYTACLCTTGIDSVDCLGGYAGLPADWQDLPNFIVNRAPEYKAIDQLERGVTLIRDGAGGLSKRDAISFQVQLGNLLADYDLIGSDAVALIFNRK